MGRQYRDRGAGAGGKISFRFIKDVANDGVQSKKGIVNLAPYSYFNAMAHDPPTLVMGKLSVVVPVLHFVLPTWPPNRYLIILLHSRFVRVSFSDQWPNDA
jgi:hypothetical protein